MLRVTGVASAVGAVIFGVILADIWHNPRGTNAVASGAQSIEKTSLNALLGKTS